VVILIPRFQEYPGTPVSSPDKNDCHDTTEKLLKVALSNLQPTNVNMKGLKIP